MKEKLTDEIRDIFQEGKNWISLEIEYAKLTAAEKFTLLMSTIVIGGFCLLMLTVILILLGLSIAELFKLMMPPALAYLSAAGIIMILALLFFVFRKRVFLDPIARFVTRLFFDR